MKKLRTVFVLISAFVFSGCVGTPIKPQNNLNTVLNYEKNTTTQTQTTTTNTSDIKFKYLSTHKYYPLNYKIQKAVWISYIDLADMITGKTKSQFETAVSRAFDNISEVGLNTVYVHVRPFGDAFYDSSIYPLTRYFTGEIINKIPFDPLKIMVQVAHEKGLSIHAWINPLRCEKDEYFEYYSTDYKIKQWYDDEDYFGKYLLSVDNSSQLWLNPAYEEVRQLICDGIKEIVENYDVDGVHIDDYFYPTTDENFDNYAFSDSKFASVTDFRLQNINLLVKEIYNTIKNVNSNVIFGISPQGNIANNYTQLYADVENWAKNDGYCDYIVPQIYYSFDNEIQPFGEVAQMWSDITNDKVQLVIGLAFYKVNEDGDFAENTGIIAKQIEYSTSLENYGGIALYNYKNIFESENENANSELALLKGKL